jgi:hypothetical protein
LRAEVGRITGQKHRLLREVAELEAKRVTLGVKPEAAAPAAEPAKPEANAAPAAEKPSWGDGSKWGQDWDKFQDARDEWVAADAEAKALAKIEAREKDRDTKRAQSTQVEKETTRLNDARKKYPDFDQVLKTSDTAFDEAGIDVLQPFIEDAVRLNDWGPELLYALAKSPEKAIALNALPLTNPMMSALRAAADPTALFLAFTDHAEEIDRIARLDPPSALVALGALSARIAGAHGSPAPPIPPVTQAKPPIRPVGGRGAAGTTRSDEPPTDFVEFVKWSASRPEYRR